MWWVKPNIIPIGINLKNKKVPWGRYLARLWHNKAIVANLLQPFQNKLQSFQIDMLNFVLFY
jgi:hypothetical protein